MFDLFTDSCCDLPIDTVDEGDIRVIRNLVTIDGKEYEDDLYVTFDKNFFYKSMADKKEVHTSQINSYTFYQSFLPAVEAGREVLYVAFSRILGGGSWGNVLQAKEDLLEKYPEARIHLVNSISASLGQGLLVLRALEYKRADLSAEETAERLEGEKHQLQHYITASDLMYLHRGGRLSMSSAAIGSLIRINPVLSISDEGRLASLLNLRGRKKALGYLRDRAVAEKTETIKSPVGIVHGNCEADALWLRDEVQEALPGADMIVKDIGPTIGAHLGPGGIAIVYFGSEPRPE